MHDISVIICTHNPRTDYLSRTLEALSAQTLAKDQWELLLVDNLSSQPLSERVDLSWHPNAGHVREEALGLTRARLCGIKNSSGRLLIFVDDDNVLEPDYLEVCIKIGENYPFLGVWGGQQIAEFETEFPAYMQPYLIYLACRTLKRAAWANVPFLYEASPIGAGLCIRSGVAASYAKVTTANEDALTLDRIGDQLTCSGDIDMAFTACDCGLGTGVFPALRLTHLIAARRVARDYMLRLIAGEAYSTVLLRLRRGFEIAPPNLPRKAIQTLRRTLWRLRGRGFDAQVDVVRQRAIRKALEESGRLRS